MIPAETPERRYAILAEGYLRDTNAKTAYGLLRYGKDEVACIVDSTLAGRSVLGVMPDLRRDAPIVDKRSWASSRAPHPPALSASTRRLSPSSLPRQTSARRRSERQYEELGRQ